jgi:predicted Zn-dependent protease
MTKRLLISAASVLVLSIFCVGCATVPVTGRKSLALLPESELASMSLSSYQQMLKDAELSTDKAQIAQVTRLGERLAGATHAYLQAHGHTTEGLDWEFNVIKDDETANAFAMPGGKIAVYTGILPIAQNDEGLAVVMSHEIAHVIAKHGNERMSQGMLTQLGGMGLSVAMRNKPAATQNIFNTSYGLGSQVGLMLPYSRMHESEADHIGIVLMAIAGYNPEASIGFWQRMDKEGDRPPQFISTHSTPERRVQNLKEKMPEALAIYKKQQQKQ